MKMTRYGKEFILNDELLETICTYMNDDIRENLHCDLAPCDAGYFLRAYLALDPDFARLLQLEFGIEIDAGTIYFLNCGEMNCGENPKHDEVVIAVRDDKCYYCPVDEDGNDKLTGVNLYGSPAKTKNDLIKAYGKLIADGTLYNMDDIEREYPDKVVDFDPNDFKTGTLVPIAEVE